MAMAAKRRREVLELYAAVEADQETESDSSDDDLLEELELVLISTMMPKNRVLGPHLNYHDVDEDSFERFFRFQKHDFERLIAALDIPDTYICHQRTICPGPEALLILLRRLTYPNRWCDLSEMFGRQEPELSMIFNEILTDIYDRFSPLLDNLDLVWLDPAAYSHAIYGKGAPLRDCWGFVDGTAIKISRPIRNQKIMYSGHKRIHCIKFQSVVAPNGMICHLFGPLEGRRHDAFMLAESGLLNSLENKMNKPNGEPYVIYGDPAYPVRRHIIAPYRGARLTPDEALFNKDMSSVRVCVEWAYGKIIRYFSFLDFCKNLKVLLQPVGKLYAVGAILSNCHTCLYGSQTGMFFNMDPPSIENYLQNR